MAQTLKRRIGRLESSTPVGADIEWARAVMRAYGIVRDYPEQATGEDRALAGDWQTAFGVLIDAAGGLGAVVQASYEIEAVEKTK